MNINDLVKIIGGSEGYKEIEKWFSSTSKFLKLGGMFGSAPALFVHTAQKKADAKALYVLRDAEEAGYFYNDILQLSQSNEVFYFPSSYKKKVRADLQKDGANRNNNSTCTVYFPKIIYLNEGTTTQARLKPIVSMPHIVVVFMLIANI